MSLHDALRTAIEARQERALAAPPAPWSVSTDDDTEVLAADDIAVAYAYALSSRQQRATANFIAAEDPAFVLLQCAEDLDVLARHTPRTFGPGYLPEILQLQRDVLWCPACRGPAQPCLEVLSVARRYAIEEDTDHDG